MILGEHQWSFAALLATCLLKLVGQLANTLLIESGALIVFCRYGIFHFLIQCFELTDILALLAWLMSFLNAYQSCCFINHINRLVRHKAIGHIAITHIHR